MQKVSKDHLGEFLKNPSVIPKLSQDKESIFSFDQKEKLNLNTVNDLLIIREIFLLKELASRFKDKTTNPFDILMKKESELIQDLALCYGERTCFNICLTKVGKK